MGSFTLFSNFLQLFLYAFKRSGAFGDLGSYAGLRRNFPIKIFFEKRRVLFEYIDAQIFDGAPFFYAVKHQLSDNCMAFTEGKSLFHQIVCAVGGVHIACFCGYLHLFGLELKGIQHASENFQTVIKCIKSIEDRFLVLLHILVIGQRQTFHGGQESHKITVDSAGVATDPGDIVLYSGNQIVVFYGNNSWAYTKLGHITDKSDDELTELLGNGNVTISLRTEYSE